jgi:hypothetical protein
VRQLCRHRRSFYTRLRRSGLLQLEKRRVALQLRREQLVAQPRLQREVPLLPRPAPTRVHTSTCLCLSSAVFSTTESLFSQRERSPADPARRAQQPLNAPGCGRARRATSAAPHPSPPVAPAPHQTPRLRLRRRAPRTPSPPRPPPPRPPPPRPPLPRPHHPPRAPPTRATAPGPAALGLQRGHAPAAAPAPRSRPAPAPGRSGKRLSARQRVHGTKGRRGARCGAGCRLQAGRSGAGRQPGAMCAVCQMAGQAHPRSRGVGVAARIVQCAAEAPYLRLREDEGDNDQTEERAGVRASPPRRTRPCFPFHSQLFTANSPLHPPPPPPPPVLTGHVSSLQPY